MIGGWKNSKSAIICNSKDKWTKFDSPDILSTEEFREYYVSFADGHVDVGVVGQEPFISADIECLEDVNYIGIATGYGGTADWKFCGYGKLT